MFSLKKHLKDLQGKYKEAPFTLFSHHFLRPSVTKRCHWWERFTFTFDLSGAAFHLPWISPQLMGVGGGSYIEINLVCSCAFSLFSLGSLAGLEGELCSAQYDLGLGWASFYFVEQQGRICLHFFSYRYPCLNLHAKRSTLLYWSQVRCSVRFGSRAKAALALLLTALGVPLVCWYPDLWRLTLHSKSKPWQMGRGASPEKSTSLDDHCALNLV